MEMLKIVKGLKVVVIFAVLSVLVGCASTTQNSEDPLENINRPIYAFNDTLDRAIMTPLAKGYRAILPDVAEQGIHNFFENLSDIGNAVNNFLQFKPHEGVSDLARVMINSTFGILGFIDIASYSDLPKHDEDFGQTLAVWGVDSGAYIVLPILGPSNVRDSIGLVVDWFLNPVSHIDHDRTRWTAVGIAAIDKRATLLGARDVLEEAALDPYLFIRDGYNQKREYMIFDGNAPEIDFSE